MEIDWQAWADEYGEREIRINQFRGLDGFYFAVELWTRDGFRENSRRIWNPANVPAAIVEVIMGPGRVEPARGE